MVLPFRICETLSQLLSFIYKIELINHLPDFTWLQKYSLTNYLLNSKGVKGVIWNFLRKIMYSESRKVTSKLCLLWQVPHWWRIKDYGLARWQRGDIQDKWWWGEKLLDERYLGFPSQWEGLEDYGRSHETPSSELYC